MARSIAVNDKAIEGSGEYTPIPEGERLRVSIYDISEQVIRNGDNKGKPQGMYTVKVVEDGPYKGREVPYNYFPLFAGAKNGWTLVAFAEAVGWAVDKDTKSVEVPDDLSEVLGTEVIAKFRVTESTKINPNTGKPYLNNSVAAVRKIKAGALPEAKAEAPSWGSL